MTDNTTGQFITVEGSEGVGKSTNMQFICDYLRSHGKTVVMTREPGGTAAAEQIREVLLQSAVGSLTDQCELLLMFAARADHVEQVIRPALQRGDWVVCDRFLDATYAYQGAGRGMEEADIVILENLVLQGLAPDLTILLDAPPEVAIARQLERGSTDRFEAEEAAFFARVRQKYQERASGDPERMKRVDTSGTRAEVRAAIQILIDKQL